MKNLHISVGIFDKGSAAFNPVSVVEIEDIVDLAGDVRGDGLGGWQALAHL